ncbi:hypothetical protein LLF88_06895, partial [bacterium]|nr:hypothetical protein [bacterium]
FKRSNHRRTPSFVKRTRIAMPLLLPHHQYNDFRFFVHMDCEATLAIAKGSMVLTGDSVQCAHPGDRSMPAACHRCLYPDV